MPVIALFLNAEFYEAYYAAAKIVSAECDTFLFKKRLGDDLRVPCAGFPKGSLDKFTKLLQRKGYTVVVQTELDLETVNQTSQVLTDDCQLDAEIDLIQECIDSLHICYSRLHYYATQRMSNRYKQPGKYLLREKARELRSFIEKMNRSFIVWRDSQNPVMDWILPDYICDINSLLIRFDRDCNLRLFNSEVKEAFQTLYHRMIKILAPGQSVQLEMFGSGDTFDEQLTAKVNHEKVFINCDWVPALAVVGRFIRRCSRKLFVYPASLVCPKSFWQSVFSGRQLSFADV
jgi:hypothetical protein